jgi:penicillin-binding protein 1A
MDWSIRSNFLRSVAFAFLGFGVLTISAGIGSLSVIIFQVYFGDDSLLQKETFTAKMNEETAIYTLDEQTRIGSFFDSVHRRYIPIDEIPEHVINAFIASEDKNFYHHHGVDPTAIFSAFVDGIKDGGFRRGGSTITQQTVKNILDKREHSFRRKFMEWVRALQLERLYDKRQIIEFYLNQFHVAHNGNGIGIAARYYFDKDVRDLDLIEAAFIAGSVKAPSKYNPFVKDTPEKKKQAWQFANQRKNYVLRRMWEQELLTKEDLTEAWKASVPFKKGKFQSKEVALVSLIRGQVNRKEILEAIGLQDLSELSTAGLKIFTTLDIKFQETAQLSMRRNLSRLETILKGFAPEAKDKFRPLKDLDVNEFYFGKVIEIKNDAQNKPTIRVDFGLPKATIPHEAVLRYAKTMDVAQPIGVEKRVKELLNALKPGHIIFAEVREYDKESHEGIVELQKLPEISGGLIAIDKGEVRAVVSGFNPEGYNRAIFATRQPGSVFKSVVYYAALQLGWSMLDQLDNERRVFPYQGRFYYPQPDHDTPFTDVSMIWAGTKSENLGSVYLTANLLDKLNFEQFKGLMATLDLLPIDGEQPRDFHYRVAKKIGVQIEPQGVREFELRNAINDVAPDLIFKREDKLVRTLRKMWWGKGYREEMQALYHLDPVEYSDSEQRTRLDLIKNNFERHRLMAASASEDWNAIVAKIQEVGADQAFADAALTQIFLRFRVLPSRSGSPGLGYFRILDGELPSGKSERNVNLEPREGRPLNQLDVQTIWGGQSIFGSSANIQLTDVRLEGYLPLGLVASIDKNVTDRFDAVMAIEDSFDLVRYFHHHDIRIALGLNYLVKLTESMGVFSKVEPVLSFPLGTNVVSVGEVAKIYQTFVEGKVYRFYKEGPANQLNFIRRIEDRFGNVLYEPKRTEHQLVLPELSLQMTQILRKVVTHGTGRLARGELYISQMPDGTPAVPGTKGAFTVRIPSFGKTGTTNDYRTASFAGFVPYPVAAGAPLSPANSNVLASYVGYDMNAQMRRGGFKVGGGLGALPAWVDFVKGIFETMQYSKFVDRLDINVSNQGEWPLKFGNDSQAVKVDLARGLLLRRAEAADAEQFALTDRYRSGELDINEFAIDTSVQSVVRVPGGGSADFEKSLRLVSLLVPEPKEGEGAKRPTQSAVTEQGNIQLPANAGVEDTSGGNISGTPSDRIPVAPTPQLQPMRGESAPPPANSGAEMRSVIPAPIPEKIQPAKAANPNSSLPKQPASNDDFGGSRNEEDAGYVEEELW